MRDFIYVKDAVDMTLFFLDNPDISGLYNVGTGVARKWNDLVTAVFAAMGKEPRIEYIDMPDSIRNQYQYFTQAEMGKLRKAGYDKQITSLEDAIRDVALPAASWYEMHDLSTTDLHSFIHPFNPATLLLQRPENLSSLLARQGNRCDIVTLNWDRR